MKAMAKMILVGTVVLYASVSFADGPTIGGNAKISIKEGEIGENIAAGVGNKSVAEQNILSIKSGNITGNAEIDAQAAAITGNIAAGVGNESSATQSIGTIGE